MPAILVVDDELSMREFLNILPDKEGYEVTTASDASSAIDLIQNQNFNLVISDIKMPVIDEVLEEKDLEKGDRKKRSKKRTEVDQGHV